MTRLLLCLFSVALCAYPQNVNPEGESRSSDTYTAVTFASDSSKNFSITNATVADFKKAKNNSKDKILYDTTGIHKNADTLKLPINSKAKSFVIFTDTLLNTDQTEIREYHYFGQFTSIGYYIIQEDYYEGSQFIIVNKLTGEQTEIWNKPMLSPSDKYIANLSLTWGMEGIPNGMQIWSVDNNGQRISKLIEIDQQVWAPYDFAWESDNSLIINVNSPDEFYLSNGEFNDKNSYYIRLKIKCKY